LAYEATARPRASALHTLRASHAILRPRSQATALLRPQPCRPACTPVLTALARRSRAQSHPGSRVVTHPKRLTEPLPTNTGRRGALSAGRRAARARPPRRRAQQPLRPGPSPLPRPAAHSSSCTAVGGRQRHARILPLPCRPPHPSPPCPLGPLAPPLAHPSPPPPSHRQPLHARPRLAHGGPRGAVVHQVAHNARHLGCGDAHLRRSTRRTRRHKA
jgi:hypothetical protein